MINCLKERYKVEKSNIEKSYEYQLGLKRNEEYQKRVDDTFLELAKLFKKLYPNVKIGQPKGREKADRSLKIKIEKMEIERLCKLYAIGEISKEEMQSLYNLVIDRVNDNNKDIANKIILEEIENIEDIDKIIKEKEIDENIKTAILRIANTKLIRQNNKEMQFELDKKYGKIAVRETGKLKNNLIKWESIEKIDEEAIKKLHTPFEYLKVKDLLGFKFIITDIPSDLQTDNEYLQKLIKERDNCSEDKKIKYNELCCNELAKDFVARLMNNRELLEELNIQVLADGYKHKEKQNGYIAEHIKFYCKDNPEYKFELQVCSIYCVVNSKVNVEAAHDKRPGKKRIFPSLKNKTSFLQNLKATVPRYRVLKLKDNEFQFHKCTLAENMLEFFLEQVDINSEEYKKAMQYIQEEDKQK